MKLFFFPIIVWSYRSMPRIQISEQINNKEKLPNSKKIQFLLFLYFFIKPVRAPYCEIQSRCDECGWTVEVQA